MCFFFFFFLSFFFVVWRWRRVYFITYDDNISYNKILSIYTCTCMYGGVSKKCSNSDHIPGLQLNHIHNVATTANSSGHLAVLHQHLREYGSVFFLYYYWFERMGGGVVVCKYFGDITELKSVGMVGLSFSFPQHIQHLPTHYITLSMSFLPILFSICLKQYLVI